MPEMRPKTGNVVRTAEKGQLIRINSECQSMPAHAKTAGFESLRLRHSYRKIVAPRSTVAGPHTA